MRAAHRGRCKMSQICQIYLCPNVIQMQAAQKGRFSFFMVTFLASGNSHLYLGRHNLTLCNHTHSRPHIQTCQNSEPAMQPQTAVIMQCIVEKIFFVENVQMSTGWTVGQWRLFESKYKEFETYRFQPLATPAMSFIVSP